MLGNMTTCDLLRLRIIQKAMITAMTMIAMPPMTPPTMAPVFEDLLVVPESSETPWVGPAGDDAL